MKKKQRGKPTREILAFARQQPGGIIRWHEARDIYREASPAARAQERREANRNHRLYQHLRPGQGGLQYHMSLAQTLKRNFHKVEGTNGFYVLKSSVVADNEGDVLDQDLYEWEREAA